jgi:RNA polymerase sigma-70 factor (ECF subfamily)
MVRGASMDEAKEAVAETLVELVQRWDDLTNPFAWAKRAARSHFFREKQRGPRRIRRKMVEQAAGSDEGQDDPELTVWEDNEWITQLLERLPPKQREVLALVLDGFAPAEIAELLGRSSDAVRQNLYEARKRLRSVLRGERADESGPDGGDD